MRIEPAALAKSIGTLTTLDPSEGFPEALQQVVDAAKLLFEADGAGLMLVGKGELLTWPAPPTPRPSGQRPSRWSWGPAPAWSPGTAKPSSVRDVEAEAHWSEVAPALVAAQLRAAWRLPVELAGGPIGTLEVYAAGPRDWNDREVAALWAYAGVVVSLLRAAAAARAQGELAEQLQWALQHRVLIEQAKGVLMEREGLSPAAAFERLRAHGPHGWAHRRRAGRCRPGRGSLPCHREPSRTASRGDSR